MIIDSYQMCFLVDNSEKERKEREREREKEKREKRKMIFDEYFNAIRILLTRKRAAIKSMAFVSTCISQGTRMNIHHQ
jgi:hypothetical protein